MKNRKFVDEFLRDRHHPLDIYDDVYKYARLRFKIEGIKRITDLIAPDIHHKTDRNGALSSSLQVCVALRYFATSSLQNLVGDSIQIHKSTVCRVIRRVSLALCHHMNNYMCMPSINVQNTNRQKFHAIAGFPDVVGCVDGTQIRIKAPTVDENAFVNRKGFHSLNTQVIFDPSLCFLNCVARWPGSKHDSFILRRSNIFEKLDSGEFSGILLGDSAYPLKKWLMTPYLNPVETQLKRWSCLHRGMAAYFNLFDCIF